MSATRDQSQKIGFVYSNLYQLYRKGMTAAQDSQPLGLTRGSVLKNAVIKPEEKSPEVIVKPFSPVTFIKPPAPPAQAMKLAPTPASIQQLKQNLNRLGELQSKLRFMLQELEDLVKNDKK